MIRLGFQDQGTEKWRNMLRRDSKVASATKERTRVPRKIMAAVPHLLLHRISIAMSDLSYCSLRTAKHRPCRGTPLRCSPDASVALICQMSNKADCENVRARTELCISTHRYSSVLKLKGRIHFEKIHCYKVGGVSISVVRDILFGCAIFSQRRFFGFVTHASIRNHCSARPPRL